MKTPLTKRTFLLLITIISILAMHISCTTPEVKKVESEQIILSVNAYSFSDLLMARDKKNNQPVYTLFNLLDWCAANHIKALDPTGYFFPDYPKVPSDQYIEDFKNRAAELGIAISGTGIRNNFASPDPAIRAAGVELAKEWIVVASKLGAPVIRLFAGAIPEGYEDRWDEVAGWMIECYKECVPVGEKYGVIIGVQNHGDMLQTADQCIKIIEAVNSEWIGIIVDTGYFLTENPYADIEAVIPYAVNWQVKECLLGKDSGIKIDYARLVNILKENDYRGYLPVETLWVQGEPYDPFVLVTEMLEELRNAM